MWRDTQVRTFVAVVAAAVIGLAAWLWIARGTALEPALRLSAFNTISVITGTGYSSTDYGAWGGFAVTALLFLMAVGGCTGSTTGGLKVFRLQVFAVSAAAQTRRLLQPHGVFVPHYNRKPVPNTVTDSVLSFFFLFVVSFVAVALTLAIIGLDFMTSVSGALTALANVGPGLGETIGPAGTFAPLPDAAKWVLSAAMLLGRLEFFTVLVLFTPRFWRG